LEDYWVIPFSNDLSDHDAQILTIKISFQIQSAGLKIVRKVDKYAIMVFICKLSNESWDSIFHFNSVYYCSYDPEGVYGLQDIEHVNSIQLCQYTLQYSIIHTSSLK
jgi:hypothetical protein